MRKSQIQARAAGAWRAPPELFLTFNASDDRLFALNAP
jgi:hypothetical protein